LYELDFRRHKIFIAGTLALALVSLTPYAQSQGAVSLDADAVVLELRGLPAELYTGPMSHLCNAARLAIAKIDGDCAAAVVVRDKEEHVSSA
jgi:hypothetical protein